MPSLEITPRNSIKIGETAVRKLPVPRISVVVPTFRRAALLARCLDALKKQRLNPAEYEIIVADDAACGATRRQVDDFARHVECRVVYVAVTGTHGPAAARNAGWQAARAEIIAFTDDDCVPSENWLLEAVTVFDEDPNLAAATGPVQVPLPEQPTDYELDAAGLESADFVTANCFCRRGVLQAIGGFDERFQAAWREDSDLHFTLLERGAKLGKVLTALVVHPVRAASWGVSLRQQRKCLFDALLYKKHKALFQRHIMPGKPRYYYVICICLGLALAAVAAGWRWIAMATMLVWSLETAYFCLKRLRRTSKSTKHIAEMMVTSALIPPLSVFWRVYGAIKFRTFFW